MTVRLMRIACWIHKATNTHSQYVILIVLPLLLWLDDVPQCYVVCTFLSSCSLSTVILALKIQGKTEVCMAMPVVMLQKERHRNEHEK